MISGSSSRLIGLISAAVGVTAFGIVPAKAQLVNSPEVPSALAQWTIQSATSTNVSSKDTSLKLDSAGRPHIAFINDNGQASYTMFNGSSWQAATVADASTGTGRGISLALDANDHPHIAHSDSLPSHYVFFNGSSWSPTENIPRGATYVSLQLTASGAARVAFRKAGSNNPDNDGGLKYALRNGANWSYESIEPTGSEVADISLALTGANGAGIAFRDGSDLYFTERLDSGWSTPFHLGDSSANAVSLAFDSAGNPHIAYRAVGELRYRTRQNGIWSFDTVDNKGSTGSDSSLALDALGRPHISYIGTANGGGVHYAYHNGSEWISGIVVDTAGTSSNTSLALDSLGRPHISYYNSAGDGTLKYALGPGLGAVVAAPEPGTCALFALGFLPFAAGIAARHRRAVRRHARES